MATVVITGGSGFVGAHLQRELAQAWPDARIVSWDRGAEAVPGSQAEAVGVDITKPVTYLDSLIKAQPDWIVHLAAFSAPGESFNQKELVREINVEATRRLLESASEHSPATKVLVASSADIYGLAEAALSGQPVKELPLDEARPRNPYAESKLEMERMIVDSFNGLVLRVRPFPHIGPGQKQGFVTADFAAQIAAIEAGKQAPVMKVGNLEAQRDFTDVRDVVRAYRMLMEKGSLGEAYHVATGRGVAVSEILKRLLQESDAEIEVEQDPDKMRPSDVPVLVGDAGKLTEETGWKPEIGLEASLRDILGWWRSQYGIPSK